MVLSGTIVTDAGFELPAFAAGKSQYLPTGTAWTFTGKAGIANNGSAFGATTAPEGNQVGFLQIAGSSFSQQISGFKAGTYYLAFDEEGRSGYGGNPFDVLLDSQVIVASRVPPSVSSFDDFNSSFTVTTAGTHTLTFQGLGITGKDVTTFIDNIYLSSTAPGVTTVSVSDAGGTFSGNPFAATGAVNGGATLEGVGVRFNYAITSSGKSLGTTAPSSPGNYTVTAWFPGSADYLASSNSTTFAVRAAMPTVNVSDAGGTFNGLAFPATATVAGVAVGVDDTPAATLEGVAPALSYYIGNTATGIPLAAAPSAAGTYTVVATFPGSADYGPALSPPQTFSISSTLSVPALVSTWVGDGSAQRSTVSGVTVVFNEAVNFSPDSFTLQKTQNENAGFAWTDVSSGVTASNPSGDGMTWVISVIPDGVLDRTGAGGKGLFSDGIYQLTLNGATITDAATGMELFNGGNSQVVPFQTGAGLVKNAFSILFGDLAGTGGPIAAVDYGKFKAAYDSAVGYPSYSAAFDYNGDGVINAIDYGRFKSNFGKYYSFT